MHSSTSNFERPIPDAPWRSALWVTLGIVLVATIAWELRARAMGYPASLNDTIDLWIEERNKVEPDSLVIIGASRANFDIDLDTLEAALGERPIQLAMTGTCPFPLLVDLANDESFHGKIICSIVPPLYFVPAGPLLENAYKAINGRKNRTPSQYISNQISMALEERLAFLKQEDLTLAKLLEKLPIENRPGARVAPQLPYFFGTIDRRRQIRMIDACAQPGELQTTIQNIWIPLFTPPPPPSFVPPEAFEAGFVQAVQKRFADTVAAVEKFRQRGGQIVFIRPPSTGTVRDIENRTAPRERTWDPLLAMTQAPGIHFEDFPELAGFECPEWSHLSAPDAVEFTKRIGPKIKAEFK